MIHSVLMPVNFLMRLTRGRYLDGADVDGWARAFCAQRISRKKLMERVDVLLNGATLDRVKQLADPNIGFVDRKTVVQAIKAAET